MSLVREVQAWVASSAAEEHAARVPYRGGSQLLLGVLVYGKYVPRFVRYCVRSLCAEGNLGALSTPPTVMIHTDKKSLPALAKGLARLTKVAKVFAHPIADDLDVLHRRHKDNRYVLLGASELISLKRAYFRGMHFHCLFPDVVYPTGYFRNLERLASQGHRAILTHSLNATYRGLGEEIRGHIPGPDRLADLALRNMHKRQRSLVMNGRPSLEVVPSAPHFVYVGRDRVRIAGMHASVAFLHNELLSFAGLHLNATLDAMLPHYIPEGTPLYMPQREDGMTLVELSDEAWTFFHRRVECSLHELALRFWVVAKGERGYADVFGLTTEFPLKKHPPWKPMTEGEIDASLGGIRKYVDDLHPEVIRAFDMGGILEESGVNGPLYLPQDRIKEAVLAARTAS